MQARPAGIVGAAQTNIAGQLDERPSDGPFGQACTALGKKEARADRLWAQSVAAARIGLQSMLRRWVERHIARLAEFCVADRQYAVHQIGVTAIKAQRFAATHAGRRVQAEERGVGLWPQPDRRR